MRSERIIFLRFSGNKSESYRIDLYPLSKNRKKGKLFWMRAKPQVSQVETAKKAAMETSGECPTERIEFGSKNP